MSTIVGLYNLVQTILQPFLLKIPLIIHPTITALPLLLIFLDFLQNIQVLKFIVRFGVFFIISFIIGFLVIIGFCETQKIRESAFKMFHSLNFLLFLILLLFFAILLSLKFQLLFFSLKLSKTAVFNDCELSSFETSVWLRFCLFAPGINRPIEFAKELLFVIFFVINVDNWEFCLF
jgi:hypothetical protein